MIGCVGMPEDITRGRIYDKSEAYLSEQYLVILAVILP